MQTKEVKDDLFGAWEPTAAEIAPTPPKRRVKRLSIISLAILGLGATAYTGWNMLSKAATPGYGVAEVKRDTIAQTISATGKVQAVTTVQVGTQVSGTVSNLYADFNQQVKAGQLIAKLDPSQFEAQLTQAKASLAGTQAAVQTAQMSVQGSEANIQAAQANLDRTDSIVEDARKNLELTENMVKQQVRARRDLEMAQATVAQAAAQRQQAFAQLNQAKAQALSVRSQLVQAQAQARQAQASVDLAEVNVQRTLIHAPIDGVVVSRNVDVGQTVAASLQAPTLFLIAKDLTKMQVLADVDEADVGRLTPDSKVTFRVDAFPQDTFKGRISQIRLSPMMVQNVVTYTAVIDVDNTSMKLKPGMTANITATVAESANVIAIPNAALRFRPENAGSESKGAWKKSDTARKGTGAARPNREQASVIWREEAGALKPVRVKLGLTDGVSTEVLNDAVHEGDRIAVPKQQTGTAATKSGTAFPMGGASKGGRR
jgi:HlyD family secretion protein